MEIKKLPLFIITGASGTGKTTVAPYLREILEHFDVFDIDPIFEDVGDWQKLKNIWLQVASDVAKSKRMTILCGTIMPWDIEKCRNKNDFSHIYYINLHCDDEIRSERLRDRGWSEEVVEEHRVFAKWLIENADEAFSPPMQIVHTSNIDVREVALNIKNIIVKTLEN